MPQQPLTAASPEGLVRDTLGEVLVTGTRHLAAQFVEPALGREAAAFFSQPSDLPGGSIEWSTPLEGPVRPAESLCPADWNALAERLCALAKNFSELAKILDVSGDLQKRTAAAVLEKTALSMAKWLSGAPAPLKIFLVGHTPAAACWGMSFRGGTPLAETPPTPEQAASASLILQNGRLPAALLKSGGPGAPPPGPAGPPPKWHAAFWGALRTAVSAFATLALIFTGFFLLFPGLREGLAQGPATLFGAGEARALQARLYSLKGELSAAMAACPAPAKPEGPAAPAPLERPALPQAPEAAEAAADAGADVIAVPKAAFLAGDELTIPEGADPDDVSFLEGCWKSDAGIQDSVTELPIFAVYCLDAKGRGTCVFELYDKEGRQTGSCSGGAAAKRSGNTITITNDGPLCAETGRRFTVDVLTCVVGEGGSPSCRVSNPHTRQNPSKPYYDTKFTYVGGG
jgi:hypothetical protein